MAEFPVGVVGAGPVGLITALGLTHHGVDVEIYEKDSQLSLDAKAGTVLTRTLEVLDRYGALDDVLDVALRLDEIGEYDRSTNQSTASVDTTRLVDDTRFPFLINVPQHELEPALLGVLQSRLPDQPRLSNRVLDFTIHDDHVAVRVQTPNGVEQRQVSHLLACDGGRSTIREQLGVEVEG